MMCFSAKIHWYITTTTKLLLCKRLMLFDAHISPLAFLHYLALVKHQCVSPGHRKIHENPLCQSIFAAGAPSQTRTGSSIGSSEMGQWSTGRSLASTSGVNLQQTGWGPAGVESSESFGCIVYQPTASQIYLFHSLSPYSISIRTLATRVQRISEFFRVSKISRAISSSHFSILL
jgi:hypothetical protein